MTSQAGGRLTAVPETKEAKRKRSPLSGAALSLKKGGPLSAAKSRLFTAPARLSRGPWKCLLSKAERRHTGYKHMGHIITGIKGSSRQPRGKTRRDRHQYQNRMPAKPSDTLGHTTRHQLSHGDTAPFVLSCPHRTHLPTRGTHESTQARPAEGGRGARASTVRVGSRCHRRNTVAQIWGHTCPLARAPPAWDLKPYGFKPGIFSPSFILHEKPHVPRGVHACAQWFEGHGGPGEQPGPHRAGGLASRAARQADGEGGICCCALSGRPVHPAPVEGSLCLVAVAGCGATVIKEP